MKLGFKFSQPSSSQKHTKGFTVLPLCPLLLLLICKSNLLYSLTSSFPPSELIKNRTTVAFLTSHSVAEQARNLTSHLSHSWPGRKERSTALFPAGTHNTKEVKAFLSSHGLLSPIYWFTCCPPINPNGTGIFSHFIIFRCLCPSVILIYSGLIHPLTLFEWLVMASHVYPPPLHLKCWSFCSHWVALKADPAQCCLLPTSPMQGGRAATDSTNPARNTLPLPLTQTQCKGDTSPSEYLVLFVLSWTE